jgi:hypothetical protein
MCKSSVIPHFFTLIFINAIEFLHLYFSKFQNLAPGIKISDRGSLSLLGSPIFDQGFKNTAEKTIITVKKNLLNKAELLCRHVCSLYFNHELSFHTKI